MLCHTCKKKINEQELDLVKNLETYCSEECYLLKYSKIEKAFKKIKKTM